MKKDSSYKFQVSRFNTANFKLETLNRKGMALFMPVFTIAFIIALFTLVSYTLSDKMELLQSNGVGAEAVIVTKTLWTKEIELSAQESMLKSSFCTALNNTNAGIEKYFESADFSRIVEKMLQDFIEKESGVYSIGITSINPLSFNALPRSIEEKEISVVLYTPDADDSGVQKRTVSVTRPTRHAITISSNFSMSPIILARDAVQDMKRKCSLERTFDTRTDCMKSLTKAGVDGVIFVVRSSGENAALRQNEYSVEVISSTKPTWCSNLGRTTYSITLPESSSNTK